MVTPSNSSLTGHHSFIGRTARNLAPLSVVRHTVWARRRRFTSSPCVVNFPPRQIGKHLSEVLTLGVPDDQGKVVLIGLDRDVPVGGRLY
jgi:hypothetical protein